MIGVVSLVVESGSSSMLVFEYFCQNSFSVAWLPIDGLAISLDAHSSSMNSVKLVLHCSSRRALTSSRARVVSALSHGRPLDVKLGRLSRY